MFFPNFGTESLFPVMCSWISSQETEKLSHSFYLSVCLSLCLSLPLYLSLCLSLFLSLSVSLSLLFICMFARLSVRLSMHPSILSSVNLSFFFSSRIPLLNGKFIIFLFPEIRDENGYFFYFPKIGGEKSSGMVFTRILGTAETWRKNYGA